MNKKEVLEIRKQFSPENCTITRICGCYVDHEKQKILELKKAFLSMPEDEAFKYFDIFKKTLSGTIGKNFLLTRKSRGARRTFCSNCATAAWKMR